MLPGALFFAPGSAFLPPGALFCSGALFFVSIEVEGITDLLLQVTKAVDTADTTVTHSYFSLVIIWHIELHY